MTLKTARTAKTHKTAVEDPDDTQEGEEEALEEQFEDEDTFRCVICKGIITGQYGNNAKPVAGDRGKSWHPVYAQVI